jgi:hypothetical protein
MFQHTAGFGFNSRSQGVSTKPNALQINLFRCNAVCKFVGLAVYGILVEGECYMSDVNI